MYGCGEQEAGVASGSGWNLWVWLVGVVGCGILLPLQDLVPKFGKSMLLPRLRGCDGLHQLGELVWYDGGTRYDWSGCR